MFSLILAAALAAPFPLPAVDGKPLSVKEGQKSFRLPTRFDKVKAFYQEQFKDPAEVTVRTEGGPGARKLKLVTHRKGDGWVRATVSEAEMETVIDVVPVIRLADEKIEGHGKPLVEFVFGRSAEVQKSLDSIDHAER
jgi:hypothetical protein